MARLEIIVQGFNKAGRSMGKTSRVLASSRSRDWVLDNIDQVKSSIKVGQCGKHIVVVSDDLKAVQRIDMGRRGTVAATVGEFTAI